MSFPEDERPDFSRWLVVFAVMSSAVMEVLDTSVVNVSLPHMAGSLSATVDEATWVLTSYIVANAIILPITGWLAGILGRKRLLLIVVTGFTLSSVLCGMAPNLPLLIFFRVLQGTTGGGLQPLSQAVLLDEFPGSERGKAMGFWGLGIVAAPILGPTLGGWITDSYSWRWVFYINLPVGLLSLILISLFVHDPHHIKRGAVRVDAIGLGMLAVGMGSLQVMLDKGQEEDWFGSRFIVLLAVLALVFLAAFIFRELRTPEPIVRFRLLRHSNFATGVALAWVLGFVLYGSLILLPLFMQTLLGWTALTAGLWTSPRGIGTALLMPLVGFMLSKGWDGRWLLALGFIVASLALFGFSTMTLQSGTWDIFFYQINQGLGMAFVFVPLTTLTMEPISKLETGYATSLYSVMRNVGSSMGISFVTTWLARRSQYHQSILASHVTPYDLPFRQAEGQISNLLFFRGGADPTTAGKQAMALIYGMVQRQASLLSFIEAFRVMGIGFLACTLLILLMRRSTTRRDVESHE
jgi:DHA2 family multidrug resistance protein